MKCRHIDTPNKRRCGGKPRRAIAINAYIYALAACYLAAFRPYWHNERERTKSSGTWRPKVARARGRPFNPAREARLELRFVIPLGFSEAVIHADPQGELVIIARGGRHRTVENVSGTRAASDFLIDTRGIQRGSL